MSVFRFPPPPLAACAGAVVLAALLGACASPASPAAAQRLTVMGIAPSTERLVQFAAQGDVTMVELLLASGVRVDSTDPVRHVTALHNAASQGHTRLVKLLIERGALVDAADWHGNTPLIAAAYAGRLDAARLLLQNGAQVNAVSKEGQTALSVAALRGDKALTAYLLEQGAAPRQPEPESRAESAGATILTYSGAAKPAPYDPALFGASEAAGREAARIVQKWQSEPVTLPWTSLMLGMFVKHKIAPTRGARGSALVHVAMYDAWQLGQDDTVRRIAVSTAASQVLGYLFPAEEHGFDRILAALLRQQPATSAQLSLGLQLGRQAGQQAIARGESDGAARGWNGVRLEWYGEGRYYGPGAWEPTAPYFYYPPDEPFAPGWKPWYWRIDAQSRPVPPAFGSPRFLKSLQEVVDIQKNITPEQVRIAKFWVDGSGSVTPPGHWNQIAMDMVRNEGLDERQTVQLFAVLNVALADAFVAVWDVKYHYWTARPITMARTVLGTELKTTILTPPFPSYISGHAAFSGAAASVIGAFFPAQAPALQAMADEAAMSRLYGGIHYRHDNEDGLVLGRAIGAVVLREIRP
jgi:membrane-associated phospholipid phosphatase